VGKPDLRQVRANQAKQRDGRLHDHSHLPQGHKFGTSDLRTGSVFAADLERLTQAIDQWRQCSDSFEQVLRKTPLSTRIADGSGPIAHALGTRFNHRIGTEGGVGYATDAYLSGLQQILDGLIKTTEGYAQTEATAQQLLADEQGSE
jgi:hypothetical protein